MASNQNNVVGLAQSQASVADQQAIRSLSSTSLPSSDNSSLRSTSAASGPPHYVDLHVSAGECVSLQLLDGQEQVVAGPATITMISQQQAPPVPIPVQVPHGHMIHQIADENGTLTHIILSVMDSEKGGAAAASDPNVIDFPHLQTVDGQMYGYPACCCCCYCDPNEATAVAAAAAASAVPGGGLAGQPDVIMMTAPMSQHDMGPTPAPTTGGRGSGRNSANNYNNSSHQQQPYNHHHHNNNNIGSNSVNNKFGIKSHQGNKGASGGGVGGGGQYNKQHAKMNHNQQHNNYGNHHHYNQTTAAYGSVASGDFPTVFHQDGEAIPFKTHQAAATYQPNVFSSYTASSNQNNQLYSSNHLQSPPQNRRNRSSDNHSLSAASSRLDDVQHNGTKRHTLRVNQQTSNAQGFPTATQQQQVPSANGSASVSPMRPTRKQQKHNNAYQQPHSPNGFRTHLQASHTTNQQHQVTTLGSSPSRDPHDKRATTTSNVSSEAATSAPESPPSEHKWNYKEISAKSVTAVVVEPSRSGGDDDQQQQKHQNSTSSSSKKQQQQTVSNNTNKDTQALKSTPQDIKTTPKRHQSPPVSETSGPSNPELVVSLALPTAHQTTTSLKPATPPPAPTQSSNTNAIESPANSMISSRIASSGPLLSAKESDNSQVPVEKAPLIAATIKQQQKSKNDDSLDKREQIKSSKRSPVVTDQGNKRDQEASSGNQDASRSSRGKQKKGSSAKDEVKDKQVVQEAVKVEDKPELKTGKDTSRDELARSSRVELAETNDKPKQALQQQQPPPSKRSSNKLESSERVGPRPTNGSTSNKHHKSSTVNATNNDLGLGLGQQSSATNRTNNQSSSHKMGGGVNHANNKHHHQHHNHHNHNHNSNQSLKVSNLLKQCRNKLVTNMEKLVQNSLSSYSDTKFAGLILIIFTMFAMLLAIFIHYYIIAPVNVAH